MLLKEMHAEKKKLFMQLIEGTIYADSEIKDEEEKMFNSLCDELSVERKKVDIRKIDVQVAINELAKISTVLEKRTMAFDIISLICVDKNINETEKELVTSIMEAFNIPNKDIDDMYYFAQEQIDIQQDIEILLLNPSGGKI